MSGRTITQIFNFNHTEEKADEQVTISPNSISPNSQHGKQVGLINIVQCLKDI